MPRPAPGTWLALLLAACVSDPGAPGVSSTADPVDVADPEEAFTPPADVTTGDPVIRPRRVLVVVVDDMSAATTPMYADDFAEEGFETASMPTVEGICSQGVRFRQAWAAPTCAPSRAMMMTGRYNFRSDTVDLMGNDGDNLSTEEPTLPRVLASTRPELALAHFGKWNLGHTDANGGESAPNIAGWTHYSGFLEAAPGDYYSWDRTENGATATSSTYITTQTVDDTIGWLSSQPVDQPWVVWLAFTAPHAPFHVPPADLHSYGDLPEPPARPEADTEEQRAQLRPYYFAASEAMDTELGRLMTWLAEHGQADTDVIFIADNGAPPEVAQEPMDPMRGKGTTFEGGVHVPLCISGPSVSEGGRVADAPVSAVDLLATVLDLAGGPVDEVLAAGTFDSQSLAPVLRDPSATLARDWIYTEAAGDYTPYGASRAILQGGDKLIQFTELDGTELFDLTADPFEDADQLDGLGWDDDDDDDDHDDAERSTSDHHDEEDHEAELERVDSLAGMIDELLAE